MQIRRTAVSRTMLSKGARALISRNPGLTGQKGPHRYDRGYGLKDRKSSRDYLGEPNLIQ